MKAIQCTGNCFLLCLFLAAGFWGCGPIDAAIEKQMYESTREEGTRNWEVGRFYVHQLGDGVFRITYTADADKYNAGAVKYRMDKRAAELARAGGYTHFAYAGRGQTGRENVLMFKAIVRCYGNRGKAVPPGAISADSIR